MINNITTNQLTKEKTFSCTDDKTGETFLRVTQKDVSEVVPLPSNTEAAFSDKTIDEFKKWLKDKKYMAKDCWCKHIKEFVDANIERII